MLNRFFKLFSKKESEEITKMGQQVIREVTKEVDDYFEKELPVEPTTPVVEKQPSFRKKSMSYYTSFGNRGEGIAIKKILSTRKDRKDAYVIVVVNENGTRLRVPILKWVSEEFCAEIKALDVSRYDKKYFDVNSWEITRCSLK